MTNKEIWQHYAEYTDKVTSIARKLGFAAIAVIWVIGGSTTNLTASLRYALLVVVLYFMMDLFQFFVGSLIMRRWIRNTEKFLWKEKKSIEGNYQKPAWLDIPSYILWLLKILILFFGYFLIGVYIFK